MTKINIITKYSPVKIYCTNCNQEIKYNGYQEMVQIVRKKYKFCPNCGKRFTTVQINNIDFNNCPYNLRTWASQNEAGILI